MLTLRCSQTWRISPGGTVSAYCAVMTLQQQAANHLALALAKHHMGSVTAMNSDGYTVHIEEHPEAAVYFKRDQFGGLLVEYVFDARPPVRYNYSPIDPLAAPELAQLLIDRIAGAGGRSSAL